MQGMSTVFPDHEHLRCPRCDSMNTKFCYYNNYNLSQPRYFCKNCRRYWTKGGALRNIPVGGGTRKNAKRRSVKKTPSPDPRPPSSGNEMQTTLDANASLIPSPTYDVVQFENLFDGSSSEQDFHVGENSSVNEGGGEFNVGLPDLSIYTPDFYLLNPPPNLKRF